MTHNLNLTTTYYDHAAIPPRCRNPRPAYMDITVPLAIPTADSEDVTLALSVGADDYYHHDGKMYSRLAEVEIPAEFDARAFEKEDSDAPYIELLRALSLDSKNIYYYIEFGNSSIKKRVAAGVVHHFYSVEVPNGSYYMLEEEERARLTLQENTQTLLYSGGVLYRETVEPYLTVRLTDEKYYQTERVLQDDESLNLPWEQKPTRFTLNCQKPLSPDSSNYYSYSPYQVFPVSGAKSLRAGLVADHEVMEMSARAVGEQFDKELAALQIIIHRPTMLTERSEPAWMGHELRRKQSRALALVRAIDGGAAGERYVLVCSDRYDRADVGVLDEWIEELLALRAEFAAAGFPLMYGRADELFFKL